MKVVFDTNIYISAFVIPGGNAEKAYLKAIEGQFELCTSVAILTELANKLAVKFDWEEHRIEQLIKSISDLAVVLKTKPFLHVVLDEPDNRILECALKAKAEFVVTGDKHLLKLQSNENTEIIRLSSFITLLQQSPDE